jgi:hypothetical protein
MFRDEVQEKRYRYMLCQRRRARLWDGQVGGATQCCGAVRLGSVEGRGGLDCFSPTDQKLCCAVRCGAVQGRGVLRGRGGSMERGAALGARESKRSKQMEEESADHSARAC